MGLPTLSVVLLAAAMIAYGAALMAFALRIGRPLGTARTRDEVLSVAKSWLPEDTTVAASLVLVAAGFMLGDQTLANSWVVAVIFATFSGVFWLGVRILKPRQVAAFWNRMDKTRRQASE